MTVLNVFLSVLKMLWSFAKWLVLALVVALIPLFLMLGGFAFYYIVVKKMPLPKRTVPRPKQKYNKGANIFKKLYIDFPKRVILDRLTKNPDAFDTFGVHIFAGEQGSGKSMAMMHFVKCIQERNPLCKVASNIDVNFDSEHITCWQSIMDNNNGELGQIVILDEIQNWFNSNESRNFPPEMLTEITQQRKQRKCVIGTSQVFTRIAKPIREQITLLYKPLTIAGALTFVRVYKCSINDEGTVDKMRLMNAYFFVHDDELRASYDTYEKVQRLAKGGFLPRSEQLTNSVTTVYTGEPPKAATT